MMSRGEVLVPSRANEVAFTQHSKVLSPVMLSAVPDTLRYCVDPLNARLPSTWPAPWTGLLFCVAVCALDVESTGLDPVASLRCHTLLKLLSHTPLTFS